MERPTVASAPFHTLLLPKGGSGWYALDVVVWAELLVFFELTLTPLVFCVPVYSQCARTHRPWLLFHFCLLGFSSSRISNYK